MKAITRRDFLKGLAAAGATYSLTAATQAYAFADEKSIVWDDESELIIVGSGTGLFAAIFAAENGHKSIVLEKNGVIGGTTATSGCGLWVPCNRWMKAALGSDWTEEEAIEYLKKADLYNSTTDEKRKDYVHNMHRIVEYLEDELNIHVAMLGGFGEYDKVVGATTEGHSIVFADPATDEWMMGGATFSDVLIPMAESLGVDLRTNHPVKDLIKDETGKVIGVHVKDNDGNDKYFHATKAVILAAGGFDHNEEMCRAYLRGPLCGTLVSSGNTGDGIRMGMAVGGDLGNMQNTLGGSCFLDGFDTEGFQNHNMGYEFGSYRANAYTMIVNKHGRRFVDESVPYSNYPDAAYNYDTNDHSFTNIPAYMIFTDKIVDILGWPAGYMQSGETQPEWVKKFESLEELADYYNINKENLLEEVNRFNGFAETGVDTDFSRGTNPWALGQGVAENPDLPNKALGKIEAPYYVAMIGPASLGTKGGLKTTVDSEVVNVFGDIIDGLYAIGTNASAVLGWTYGGAGGGVGPGLYQGFKAVNKIFELHKFDTEI